MEARVEVKVKFEIRIWVGIRVYLGFALPHLVLRADEHMVHYNETVGKGEEERGITAGVERQQTGQRGQVRWQRRGSAWWIQWALM